MDYNNINNRINSHFNNKQIRDITRVKKVLVELGSPESDLKIIHVAGTNGKGSVCASLSSTLMCAGYKTGLFTSPHLVNINERIKINGKDITDEALENILNKVEDASKKINIDLTFFETLTIISIIYFCDNDCDICIFEAGMGGEFDATNIFENVELSIITNIGFDHMEILGNSIEEITTAKAGIIKNNSSVVIYDFENSTIKNIIKDKAKSKSAMIFDADFKLIKNNDDGSFDYKEYKNIKLKLIGRHQIYNACLVLEAISILQGKNYHISSDNIREGFLNVNWNARYQVISEKPYIVLDGAHNELCFDAILPQIKNDLINKNIKKLDLLVAFLKDKDVTSIIKKINTLAYSEYELKYLITTVNNYRA
jgi:dihydrofolate synthase/folylpolyglutamate synthase